MAFDAAVARRARAAKKGGRAVAEGWLPGGMAGVQPGARGDGLRRRTAGTIAVAMLCVTALAIGAGCATVPVSNPADPCLGFGQVEPARGTDPGSFEALPEATLKVAPVYPATALEAKVDGTVIVLALVCVDGTVGDVRIATSIPMLDGAATAAVRRWRFKPATLNGRPIAMWVKVPVSFRLH